jgi:hypothetical protein
MASITFAVDEELKPRMERFPWVNWSEIARENLLEKEKLEELRSKLGSKEEKELIKWSVELGRKAKKGRFKRLLSELSPKEREKLLK